MEMRMAVDGDGIPIAWVIDAGNRNDYAMFFPVLDQLADRDSYQTDRHTARRPRLQLTPPHPHGSPATALTDFNAPPRNKPAEGTVAIVGLGRRWIVKAANSWLRSYRQLEHNTDRKPQHRHAALCFAIALFITHRHPPTAKPALSAEPPGTICDTGRDGQAGLRAMTNC